MPKHGRKASVVTQSVAQEATADVSAPQLPSRNLSQAVHHSEVHHKPYKSVPLSSKEEKRKDRILTKLCSKATSHITVPATPREGAVPPLSSGVVTQAPLTPDQVSLGDRQFSIRTEGLWEARSVDPIAPPPLSPVAQDQWVDPVPSQPLALPHMIPEHLQQLIAEVV